MHAYATNFIQQEMNNIYGMFRTRCSLFQRALHHKVKIAAELMYDSEL